MFKDLKEYQEITRIYNESVNLSEEQREFNRRLDEQEFTEEEALYVVENIDEITATVINDLQEEFQVLSEETLTEEDYIDLQEVLGGALIGGLTRKINTKLARKAGPAIRKGLKTMKTGAGDVLRGGGEVAKGAFKKVKGAVTSKTGKRVLGTLAGLSGIGLLAKGVNALRKKGKESRLKDNKKQDIPSTAQIRAQNQNAIGGGNAGNSKDSGEGKTYTSTPTPDEKGGGKDTKTVAPPTSTQSEPKQTETKKKKMHPIEKKNRARFGDAHVDKLKSKQKDFKKMKKGEMSKADFIKAYPKSITAQKAAGLRDHTEWDAYDMVLEYLFSTEQVSTIEEANYVMMEMDQETIGSIVSEVKYVLDEGFIDNIKAGVKKVKDAVGGVKDKVEKRIERRKENVAINKRIKEKEANPDSKTKAQVMALNRKKEKLNDPTGYAKKQAMTGKEKAQALAKARIAAKKEENKPRGRVR